MLDSSTYEYIETKAHIFTITINRVVPRYVLIKPKRSPPKGKKLRGGGVLRTIDRHALCIV